MQADSPADRPMFDLESGAYSSINRMSSSPVWQLLDQDSNDRLSLDELAAAESLLKSRDADDNDMVFPRELQETRGLAEFANMQTNQVVEDTNRFGDPAALRVTEGAISFRED